MTGRIAEGIVEDDPDPIVEFRLLRDVLHVGGSRLEQARRGIEDSRWVRLLEEEQHSDGSWGRFHSADSSARTAIPTTEYAIDRGLALGLDGEHRVFTRAIAYLTDVLAGRIGVPDRSERNDRWETGVRLFVASCLARVDPSHEDVEEVRSVWAEIVVRSFVSGTYDPEAEREAHRDLTGASVAGSYLVVSNRYTVALLRTGGLPEAVERRYAKWLWNLPGGIGYLSVPLRKPTVSDPGVVDRWFTSVELLAGYPCSYRDEMVEWLMKQRQADGLWDLGPRWSQSPYLPLSEDWRRRNRRRHDYTTRVLTLLSAYGM